MNTPRIGSLFSGYGGLDMGVTAALGGSVAWHVEYDKAPSKILAHHWPDVPNYGDVTTVDWSQVEPVDIITGGSPCQDLSHAGKRQGMTDGTRSNLWVAMREAIAQIRPGLVVWENVQGALSAGASSALMPSHFDDNVRWHQSVAMNTRSASVQKAHQRAANRLLEYRARRVGTAELKPVLRALGRVLGDLADLGYDSWWHGLRAADIGAPHGRFRVFVVASDTRSVRRGAWWPAVTGEASGGWASAHVAGRGDASVSLLPTPRATDGTKGGPNQRGSSGDLMLPSAVTLLPTPAVNDMGEGKTVEAWDEWTAKMQAAHGNGNGHGKSLAIEAQRLLPTPTVEDRKASGSAGYGGNEFCTLTDATVRQPDRWGIYADAIARWEALTRPAPAPTQPSKKGTPQLSPAFSEWMMGLPAGHVTDVPDLSRNDMLKALGNGVVPQQAAHALRLWLTSVLAVAA